MKAKIACALIGVNGRRKHSKAEINGIKYSAPVLKRLWVELNKDKKVKNSLVVEQDNWDLNFRWDHGSAKLYGNVE